MIKSKNIKSLTLPITLTPHEQKIINSRLQEFKELHKSGNKEWFSELCFCILTANSQAKKAIDIQEYLTPSGFLEKTEQELAQIIRSFNHRFHNNKAKYTVLARKYSDIKDLLVNLDSQKAREFIVNNIKGLGYKEASHFLRNVGYSDVAIIDRHILRFLKQYQFIDEIPKTISKKTYFKIEAILKQFNLPLDLLDLIIWYHMTGKVLK